MLIIFDLDDTLIDTSRSITPFKVERALCRMVEEGLPLPDVAKAVEQINGLNRTARHTKEALEQFLLSFENSKKFLEIGVQEIYKSPELPSYIPLRKGAKEALDVLSTVHHLALVTVGYPEVQWEKLKKAGIDTSLFCKIAVCPEYDKAVHYKSVMAERPYPSEQIVICGDRIAVDLAPGKEMGCTTVLALGGRDRSTSMQKEVDFVIEDLSELIYIVQRLSINNDHK